MGGDTLSEEPSVNVSADMPLADALPSEVRKKKSKKKKSSVQNITDLDSGFSANTVLVQDESLQVLVDNNRVPVESRSNEVVKKIHAPKFDDSDPGCLKGAISLENVQASCRDVHLDSPLGTATLLEEPSMNVIPDLEPAKLPPHVDISRKKRKKKKTAMGVALDSDPGCLKGAISLENVQASGSDVHLDSPQGTATLVEEPSMNVIPDLEPAKLPPHVDISRKKRKKKKIVMGVAPDSDPGCLKGATSLENVQASGRDVHLDSPQGTATLLEEPSMNGIPDLEPAKLPPHVDINRKKGKKKKTVMGVAPDSDPGCLKGAISLENVQASGRDVHFDSPQGTATLLEEPSMNGIPDLEPAKLPPHVDINRKKGKKKKTVMGVAPDSENSCMESRAETLKTPNSEKENRWSEILETNSSKEEKDRTTKKSRKTHESKDESFGNDKRFNPSVGTSLGGNIMRPGVDPSQQPPISELAEQKLELLPLMEGVSTSSNVDLNCSEKKKKKKKRKIHESNVKGCDLSVGTSLGGNIMQGVDPSQQPLVSELAEQKLELPQPLMEGISTRSSGSPILDVDLSCSQEKKKKKKQKSHVSDVQECDLSVGTSLGGNITGVDLSQQPPVSELAEQKLELPLLLMEGISTTTNVDLSCSQEKKKKKKRKTHESNVKGCDLSVGTYLGGSIMPVVDQSVQPPVVIPSEHELEVEQPLIDGIGTRTNSESPRSVKDISCSQPLKKKSCDPSLCPPSVEKIIPGADPSLQLPASELSEQKLELPLLLMEGISTRSSGGPISNVDLSCSREKKKKRRKTHESNVKGCDLSAGTSLEGNIMRPELAEQKLELPLPLMEGISTRSNVDLSCSEKKKKKKKRKIHESNVEGCDLSVDTSLGGNIMQGVDPSQQPPVSELAEQKLELPQPLMEGINTRSSGSPIPDVDLSCSQEKKKKKKQKSHVSDVQGCDLSVGTLGGNITGVDPSHQPPVSELAEQKLELTHLLMEGISTTTNMDLSCSQEKKKKKKRKTHESNVKGCDLSVGTSLGGSIMPVTDQTVQPPVVIPSKHEVEVEQPLIDGIGTRTNSESPRPVEDISCSQPLKKRSCDPSLCPPSVEKIIPGADPSPQPLEMLSDQDLEAAEILLEVSTFQESGVKGTSLHCSDASPEAENIIVRQRTEAKTEVPLLPPSAVKADVNVAVIMDSSLSQISNSAAERSPVSCSKKKLLILDVNGLLADILQQECCSFSRYEPDIIVSRKAVFKRPFCDDFLQFCFDRFNVGVWSSRTKKNVDMVIDFLLGDSRQKLQFCWNQSHCTTTRFNTLDNRSKPLVLKELRKLWEKVDPDLPWVRGEYNESNTLLLDDSPYKALCNPANTGIFPYSYKFKDRRDPSLGPGGEIRSYLEALAAADNVQKYVEQNPFGQRPITNKSRSWSFYRKVLEEYSGKD